MPIPPGLPLHPLIVHFPIAGAFFAAATLALAVARPRARFASATAAALLLSAAVAGGIAALATGWQWADQLAYLPGGWGPIPGPQAIEGLARRHALLAFAFVAADAIALALVLASRRRNRPPVLALLAAVLACGLVAAAGHAGGTMVYDPPMLKDAPLPATR
jgi:uncharacterized membrane protein